MLSNGFNDVADENLNFTKLRKLIPKRASRMTKITNVKYIKNNNNLKKSNSNPFIKRRKPVVNKDSKRNLFVQVFNNINKQVSNNINDDAVNKLSISSNYEIPTKIHDKNELPSQAILNDSTLKYDSIEQNNASKRRNKNRTKKKVKNENNTNTNSNTNNNTNNNTERYNSSFNSKKLNIGYLFKRSIPKKKLKKHCLIPNYSYNFKPPSRNFGFKTNALQRSKDSNSLRYTRSENNYNNSRNSRINCQPINHTQIENNINSLRTQELFENKLNQKAMHLFLGRIKLTKSSIDTPFQNISNLSNYSIKKLPKDKMNNSKIILNNNSNKFLNTEKIEYKPKTIDNFYTINQEEKRKVSPENNRYSGNNNVKLHRLHKIKTELILNNNNRKALIQKSLPKNYNLKKNKVKQITEIFLFSNDNTQTDTKQKQSPSKTKFNCEINNRLTLTSRDTYKKLIQKQIKLKERSTLKYQILKTYIKISPKIEKNKPQNNKKKCISNVNAFSNMGNENDKRLLTREKLKKTKSLNDMSCFTFRKKNTQLNRCTYKKQQNNHNTTIMPNKKYRNIKHDISIMAPKFTKLFKLATKTKKVKTTEIWLDH